MWSLIDHLPFFGHLLLIKIVLSVVIFLTTSMFVVLFFGLSKGPYIFTKVMLTLIKHWCSQAIRILVYLNDGLGVCGSKNTRLRQSLLVYSDLISSGFVPNKDKCMWIPVQLLR